MLMATLVITLLGLGLGLLLGLAGRFLAVEEANPMVKEIESLLPGSQCGQCGFPGCTPAAQAVVDGEIDLTFCPPGGRPVAEGVAEIMGIDPSSIGEVSLPKLAVIDEGLCTGCTRCFRACPTSAVVGANGQIHVIMPAACTGCEKCVTACPEDCISMQDYPTTIDGWRWNKPAAA